MRDPLRSLDLGVVAEIVEPSDRRVRSQVDEAVEYVPGRYGVYLRAR